MVSLVYVTFYALLFYNILLKCQFLVLRIIGLFTKKRFRYAYRW